MNKQEKSFSRRQLLEMAIGLSAVALSGTTNLVFAQKAKRIFTPPLTLGPFYPMVKPLDQDADLTVLAGKQTHAQGKFIHLAGRVLNLKGEPVSGAKVEIWQADTHGRYSHLSDPNPAPLDPNFQGYAVQTTDTQGRYRFKTIKPGGYPGFVPGIGMRTPHIHFDVSGKIDRLVTQMFFPGEPLNEQDVILQSLKGSLKEAVFARPTPSTKEIEADAMLLVWDIVLLKG
jgi:protocatechuate 3,4-dioxygenase beta subunit